MIEKVVDIQITRRISENHLDEVMQSAYKENHSTETALVRLHNDILWSLDGDVTVALVCLDLSAAFDTIDPLRRFERRMGITGNCLDWFTSYLTNRKVGLPSVGYALNLDLTFGVPQRSILSPSLFRVYMLEI